MSDEEADEGLRARKLAASRAAVERIAIELALEQGYDRVTVEMICEAAVISPRTFFNSFGSKEGAIFGGPLPAPSAEAIRRFVESDGDVLGDLVELASDALTPRGLDPELFRMRRRIVASNPELLNKQFLRMNERESQFVRIVLDRFEHQGRTPGPDADIEDEARMVVALGQSIMRFTVQARLRGDVRGRPGEPGRQAVRLIRHIVTGDTETTALADAGAGTKDER
jgi:AcrR family transcriptional regulator